MQDIYNCITCICCIFISIIASASIIVFWFSEFFLMVLSVFFVTRKFCKSGEALNIVISVQQLFWIIFKGVKHQENISSNYYFRFKPNLTVLFAIFIAKKNFILYLRLYI